MLYDCLCKIFSVWQSQRADATNDIANIFLLFDRCKGAPNEFPIHSELTAKGRKCRGIGENRMISIEMLCCERLSHFGRSHTHSPNLIIQPTNGSNVHFLSLSSSISNLCFADIFKMKHMCARQFFFLSSKNFELNPK